MLKDRAAQADIELTHLQALELIRLETSKTAVGQTGPEAAYAVVGQTRPKAAQATEE